MNVHILGIAGTLMSGIAAIAKQLGHDVSGSDQACYPPMSTFLQEQGIQLKEGYLAQHLQPAPAPDLVIIGNALSRGNPAVEYLLDQRLPFMSGPEFIAKYALANKHVIAVAGTHGKTTTTSMIAWILEYNDKKPGFLIGGIPKNFASSARHAAGDYFVIEADEYDSAFYDKRPKFMHYHPSTLVINPIEFDHADIYDDLEQIKRQFHYLLRTVPAKGCVVVPKNNANVQDVLKRGCWSSVVSVGDEGEWQAELLNPEASAFIVKYKNKNRGIVRWDLLGQHNVHNALAAIAASEHVGIAAEKAIAALAEFAGVKRRLEVRGVVRDITIYDDFAHHPTAIITTLAGLRNKVGTARIIAVAEFASYTMRTGHHVHELPEAFKAADYVFILQPEASNWDFKRFVQGFHQPMKLVDSIDDIVDEVKKMARAGDHICVMSNRGFGGIHEKLLAALGR